MLDGPYGELDVEVALGDARRDTVEHRGQHGFRALVGVDQGVDLGRLPVPLFIALVVPDETPPLATDEDRYRQDRQDALRFEPDPLRRGELADGGVDDLAIREQRRPPGETGFLVGKVRCGREVDGRRDPGGDPLEHLGHRKAAVVCDLN